MKNLQRIIKDRQKFIDDLVVFCNYVKLLKNIKYAWLRDKAANDAR